MQSTSRLLAGQEINVQLVCFPGNECSGVTLNVMTKMEMMMIMEGQTGSEIKRNRDNNKKTDYRESTDS